MKVIIYKILIVLFYLGMIFINYLANALPLNNRSTGAVSADYPSYFTPAGFTFSIWGIIYLLLGVFIVRALLLNSSDFFSQYPMIFIILFIISCIANMSWLLLWHYDKIFLSTIVILLLLVTVVWITFYLTNINTFTRITFSIYAGWVSIAFIANITILLVKKAIPLFQNNQVLWYVIIMILGVILGLTILGISRNIMYTLVYAWAYFGIFMKHLNQSGYYLANNYNIFNGILLGLLIIGISIVFYLNEFNLFKE
ncbi:MAG: tryptophan-rich sensory protein [Bacillota bacterium]